MTMLLNPYGFGVSVSPSDVLGYAPSPTSDVFDFQGLDFTGYQRCIIYLDGITVSAADTNLQIQFYISGSLVTSGYLYLYANSDSAGAGGQTDSTSAAGIQLTHLADTGANCSLAAVIEVSHPAEAVFKHCTNENTFTNDADTNNRTRGGGALYNTDPITGFRISSSDAAISAGECLILGLPIS